MKSKILSLLVVAIMMVMPNVTLAQEKDDMYFSRKDRAQMYATTSYTTNSSSAGDNSDYANNHNFYSSTLQSTTAGSPTIQVNGSAEDDNNQYFIKDYSIKNKTDNEVKTYSGINSNNDFYSGYDIIPSYQSQYYGYLYKINAPYAYNAFGPYRGLQYYLTRCGYRLGHSNVVNYDGYYLDGSYSYPNQYQNSAGSYCSVNYSATVSNKVKYINGRKVISGARTSRTANRTAENVKGRREAKNSGSKVSTNGRSSKSRTKGTYRVYQSKNQSSSSNRNNSNSSNLNSNSNTRNSNSFRRSGSSSPSKSYSSGSKSSGSRSSSSGSRSSGSSTRSKGRGN